MKPKLLSFLLFTFTTCLPLAFTQVVEQVKDTNGNPIFPGGRFYIMPAIFGAAGGGVRFGVTGNSTCPVTVLQDYSEVVNGLPVNFSIPGIIFTETTQLNIAFEEKPECAKSSKWVVVSGDLSRFVASIGVGGVEDHKEKQIRNGSFSIEKSGFGYKFVFCPKFNPPQPGVCLDVGRRLVLTTDEPFEVVFVDADATESSSI